MDVTKSKDGVDIKPEGEEFSFSFEVDGEPVIKTIVLHDLLAGLSMKVSEGKTQSQAQSFASFAVQKGFTSEEQILDRFPQHRPRPTDGGIDCTAWKLISTWSNEIADERQRKSRESMREEGKEMTTSQMGYAFRLAEDLDKHGFTKAATDLRDLIQVNEEVEGPKGAALSAGINNAKRLIEMAAPKRQQKGSSNQPPTRVSTTQVTDPGQEEPF